MEYMLNFILSIVADVISYYVCKWLDRNDDNS